MMRKNGYSDYQIRVSLDRALDMLGESSKRTLMFYLARHYDISFEKVCSIKEIEVALSGILGSGAAIITDRMYIELQNMPE